MSSITLYEKAYAGFLAGQDISDYLLAIDAEFEGWWIEQIASSLRKLLNRDDLTLKQLVGICKLLLGLHRLPLITPGLDILLSLCMRVEDEAGSYEIGLSDERFYVSSGGMLRGPLGFDSYSGVTVEIEQHFHSDNYLYEVSWLEELSGMVEHMSIRIEDDSDDALLDWDHPDGSVFWSALMGEVW